MTTSTMSAVGATTTTKTMTSNTIKTASVPRPRVAYEDARHEDVPKAAEIAMAAFGSEGRIFYTAGSTPDQVAYRAGVFGSFLAGHLAYTQGKRLRPQRFVVARDMDSGRVLGFVFWVVQGGGSEQLFRQTDEQMPDGYTPHAEAPLPVGFNEVAYRSFSKNSIDCQNTFMGDRERCYIKYLCVDPSVQRSGAGRALMHIARTSNPTIPLYLEAATTPSAKQFYLKMGFDDMGPLTFHGAIAPMPCMRLEPTTPSLLDDPILNAAAATT